jgi:hypothetical protein
MRVQVSAIAYARNAADRAATLHVGGQVATVHQGEIVNGLQVQLSLPDSVYLRSGGDIFAVDARR